jgi:L-threonylcarbamoyladenylate synthase
MLTGTSANLSGRKSCTTAEEVQQSVGPKVDVILDGGTSANSESTVVRVAGHGIEVLRQGAVRVKEKGVRP